MFDLLFFGNNLTVNQSFVSKILNAFIISGALAIVCFAIMRHYFDAKTALAFGVLIAFMLSVGIAFIASKRRKRFGLKLAELEHCRCVAKTLLCYPKHVIDEFFLKVVQKSCQNATLKSGWIETKNQQIYCFFENKKVDAPTLAKIIRTAPNKTKKKVVLGIEFEADCAQMGAKMLSAPEIYLLLKQSKIFPKVEAIQTKRRLHLPRFFDRTKVLKYISLAILFYFASLFVIYKNLYLFFAVISLFLAFFSLIAKKQKEKFVLE